MLAILSLRETLERHNTITSQLQTLAITIYRADKLPGLIQKNEPQITQISQRLDKYQFENLLGWERA